MRKASLFPMRQEKMIRMLRNTALFLLGIALPLLPACAQTLTPAERIQQLSALNSIDAADLKPWHLKLSYQLYDDKGKAAEQGTAEEWWLAKDRWRLMLTQGATVSTFVSDGGHFFRSEKAVIPTRVQLALAGVVHPVEEDGTADSVPELRTHDFGKVKGQCIMLTQPIQGVRTVPLGLFPTYCTTDGDYLRVSWLSASISRIAEKMGTFQGHNVAVRLNIAGANDKLIDAQLLALSTLQPGEVDLSTSGLTEGSQDHAKIAGGVMAGALAHPVTPEYPASARENHVSGTVRLRAIIGTDGRIHSIHVVHSPDGDLTVAALAAVEQWTYRPYLLNGVPVSVDTTITVNFNLN